MATDVHTTLVERLIDAAVAPPERLAELVGEAGLEAVAEILVDEVVYRCPPPENTEPAHVALDVAHAGRRHRTVLRMRRDEPIHRVGADGPATVSVLEFDAADLAQRLFGPAAGQRRTGDFRNTFLPGGLAQLGCLREAAQATGTLLAGCAAGPVDLGGLAVRYGSDKWASLHWYTPHYERHFARLRDRAVRVLEIGIGGEDRELGGGSLRMWKRYFHRGLVFGADVFDKSALDEPRLTTVVADQSRPGDLIALAERHGPFDIVIDDGSHVAGDISTAFHTLLPYVRRDGLYVIEDLQTSYLPELGGSSGPAAEPHTAVGLVKRLVDDLHFREHPDAAARPPEPTEASITAIHVYHNIVFLEKGTNGEEGFPPWLRQLLAVEPDPAPPRQDPSSPSRTSV